MNIDQGTTDPAENPSITEGAYLARHVSSSWSSKEKVTTVAAPIVTTMCWHLI